MESCVSLLGSARCQWALVVLPKPSAGYVLV